MLTNTVPISLTVRTNTYSFCDEEKKRREGALKNKDYFYGRQEQYVSLINEDVDPVTVNLTNPIVNKRASLLYNRPLVRVFDGPSPSIKAIESLYSKLKIDTILQQVDLSAELTGTCLLWIGTDIDGNISLIPFDASMFSAVTESDNKTLEALQLVSVEDVMYEQGSNIQVKRVINSQIWTNSYVYKVIDGIEQPYPDSNPLGYIPFVRFKAQDVISQYLGHTPTISIRQLNAYLNQMLTNLGYMIKMQSATPVVLTGFQNGEGISVHPGAAISVPNGASAGALTLNPKITETLDVIKYLEDKIYQTSCVPRISVLGDTSGSTSGVELLIKWAPITSVFVEKASRYQKYELELANMILKVLSMEPVLDVKIKWPEDNLLPIDPEREKLAEDIKFGIRTPIDEVLKLNTNLDETDAESIVMSNLKFNESLNKGIDSQLNK